MREALAIRLELGESRVQVILDFLIEYKYSIFTSGLVSKSTSKMEKTRKYPKSSWTTTSGCPSFIM